MADSRYRVVSQENGLKKELVGRGKRASSIACCSLAYKRVLSLLVHDQYWALSSQVVTPHECIFCARASLRMEAHSFFGFA